MIDLPGYAIFLTDVVSERSIKIIEKGSTHYGIKTTGHRKRNY
jgi:hypothetical protein